MEKIDARKLTAEGREVLRRMVIRLRKQSGMPVKALAGVAGVHSARWKTGLREHAAKAKAVSGRRRAAGLLERAAN